MKHSVLRSTLVVSLCTTLSRATGLLREVLMAYYFGTSLAKSAFDVAFQIPNLFRNLLGEGALSAAFVPVFTETLEKEGVESANRLAGRVISMLAIALGMLVVGGVVLNSALLLAFPEGSRAYAVSVLNRIMFPYMFFICMVALCMAISNSFHRFVLPAIAVE